MAPSYQEIGWDGLRFRVPVSWQPAVVRPDYLLFEQDYGPVFGMRWQRVGKTTSPESLVNSLASRGAGKKLHIRKRGFDTKKIPAPDHLHWQGFSWKHGQERGEGLLLSCLQWQRAILLQFYGPLRQDVLAPLLRSILDQGETGQWLWAIYDIRARLPARARLNRARFLLGSYTLTFDLDGQLLSLHRFRPATGLLAGQDLAGFGHRALQVSNARLVRQEETVCEWEKTASGLERFLALLRRSPRAAFRLRLWRLMTEDGLLALRLDGKQNIDPDLFARLCSAYTMT